MNSHEYIMRHKKIDLEKSYTRKPFTWYVNVHKNNLSWHSIFCLTLFYLLPLPQKKMNLTSRHIYSLGYEMFVYITKITNRFQAWSFSLFDTTKVHNTKSFDPKYDYYASNEDVQENWIKNVFSMILLISVLCVVTNHLRNIFFHLLFWIFLNILVWRIHMNEEFHNCNWYIYFPKWSSFYQFDMP